MTTDLAGRRRAAVCARRLGPFQDSSVAHAEASGTDLEWIEVNLRLEASVGRDHTPHRYHARMKLVRRRQDTHEPSLSVVVCPSSSQGLFDSRKSVIRQTDVVMYTGHWLLDELAVAASALPSTPSARSPR